MLLKYKQLIEGSTAFKSLAADADSGRVSHAYVFASSDYIALHVLAKLFIARLADIDGTIAGDTLKRVSDSSLLDVIYLPLAGDKKESVKLKVSDTDYIADTAYVTPTELSHKYYVIAPEEPMAEIVQNKLLKILEEPPENARFIIFTKNTADLLPTVISRVRTVKLDTFSDGEIASELKKYYADESAIALAAASSRGLIGLAEETVENSRFSQMYEVAYDVLVNMKRSPEILPHAGLIATLKDYLPTILDYFELILRDVMVYNSGKADLISIKNSTYDIIKLSKEYSVCEILNIMPLIAKARARIKGYGNSSSIVDELLFSILEVKAKCKR